jgi:5'-3' exoribonuclease 1
MNVVIYQCAMNNNVLFKDQLQQREFEDLWAQIYNYVDNIISLAQPKQLVYLAFDGGAPRAKMNQQRQRRFQSAQKFSAMKGKLDELGVEISNETYKNNQITAGTEFMHKLYRCSPYPSNQQIRFFIKRKFSEDPRWQKLKLIYSGADVEGEGEHKILNFMILREKMPPWEKRVHILFKIENYGSSPSEGSQGGIRVGEPEDRQGVHGPGVQDPQLPEVVPSEPNHR